MNFIRWIVFKSIGVIILDGRKEYFLQGGKKGVLLIHGFTGTPGELRLLGERLNKEGYTVKGLLLPGHGTTPEDLETKTLEDWYEATKKEYLELKKVCTEVSVAGLSMGGLLALKVASEFNIKSAIIMSAPIFIYDSRAKLLTKRVYSIVKYFYRFVRKFKRDYYDIGEEYKQSYKVMPLRGVVELLKLMKICKNNVISKITVPCLIIQSKNEHTVKATSAKYIYDNVKSKIKKLVWLENSGHIITIGKEREKVFDAVVDFLKGENK